MKQYSYYFDYGLYMNENEYWSCPLFNDELELKLLFDQVIRDRGMWDGFDLTRLWRQGIISPAHWQKLQHQSAVNHLIKINCSFHGHVSSASNGSIEIDVPEVSSAEPRERGILKELKDHARKQSSSPPMWADFCELDNCLVWMVSETWKIQKTEEENILNALLRCPVRLRIKDLVNQLSLEDAARFAGWTTVLGYYEVLQSLSKEDLALISKCRSIRRLRPEEKEKIITTKLHNDFEKEIKDFGRVSPK
jgi:hypothetical protein